MATAADGGTRQLGPPGPGVGKVVLVSSTAALGAFLFGYDTAVINGAVKAVGRHFQANPFVLGLAVAIALIGAAIGAWYAGGLADRFGRVRVMVLAALFFLVSSFGSGFAFTIYDLAFWRLVGGMGVGAASVIAPAYIAEIAPARLRGRLGSLQQMAIVVGIFASLLVDYALVQGSGGAAEPFWGGVATWRWMFFSLAIPAVLYGGLALTIPESPRYLVALGELTKASEVLRRFVGGDVEHRISEIRQSLEGRQEKANFSVLRKAGGGGLQPIVWVGILLSVFQQFTGINVIFYYSNVLWQAVGFTEKDATLTSVITSVTNIVTTLVAIALVDRVGRKPLLLVGAAGQGACLLVMAITFGTAPLVLMVTQAGAPPELVPQLGAAGPIAVIAANLYVVFFGCSWGPVVWVMLGEMFNNKIRAIALAVAASAQWIANFVVTTTFPPLKTVGLGLAYGVYTVFAFLAVAFVIKFVRETKGKELEEMV